MSKVIVFGMPGSSNVQTVIMALDEMQVPYELRQLPFAEYKREPYKRELHPFGMVPAIEHGDFKLYETQAILRYLAHAFPGLQLEPGDPAEWGAEAGRAQCMGRRAFGRGVDGAGAASTAGDSEMRCSGKSRLEQRR